MTAPRPWASTNAGAEILLHDHPGVCPDDTKALSVDPLTPSHPDVRWHSFGLNAGWGHTSSDASRGGSCRHASGVPLAANLTRTWSEAISGTVPDGEGLVASLPLQYGVHRRWIHTVDAEVILHTGVPAGAAKLVNQMPPRWLQDACTRQSNTPSTHFGLPKPPPTTATPYCTRRTWRRPRTPSYKTRPRAPAAPRS